LAGVAGLAAVLGIMLGTLLRYLHLLGNARPVACLARNFCVVMLMQMLLVWTNSSDAFMFWVLLALLIVIKVAVFRSYGRETMPNERRAV